MDNNNKEMFTRANKCNFFDMKSLIGFEAVYLSVMLENDYKG